MISDSIITAYRDKLSRGWQYIYFMVDIHGTIAESTYTGVSREYKPKAIKCLSYLSSLPEIKLILWSSCYRPDQEVYLQDLMDMGITIGYFNENPESKNTMTGCFDQKFYFNVGLDDKFGFNPETDFEIVEETVAQARETYK